MFEHLKQAGKQIMKNFRIIDNKFRIFFAFLVTIRRDLLLDS